MELMAVVLANRAVLLENEEEALKSIEAAARSFPGLPLAWVNKGFLLAGQGKYEDAIAAYEHALELDPYNPYALNGCARLMQDARNSDTYNPRKSRDMLENALQHIEEPPAFLRNAYRDAVRLCEMERAGK